MAAAAAAQPGPPTTADGDADDGGLTAQVQLVTGTSCSPTAIALVFAGDHVAGDTQPADVVRLRLPTAQASAVHAALERDAAQLDPSSAPPPPPSAPSQSRQSPSSAFAVAAVSPAAFVNGCFACFSRLVPGLTPFGQPSPTRAEPTTLFTAAKIADLLRLVLANLSADLSSSSPSAATPGPDPDPSPPPPPPPPVLHLFGFSKGAVVLTRFIEEAAAGNVLALLPTLRSLHFVDAGLNCPGVYPLHASAVAAFAAQTRAAAAGSPCRVFIHGTPRQRDIRRPWIACERTEFVHQLLAHGAEVEVLHYFPDNAPSLIDHFLVLDALRFPPPLAPPTHALEVQAAWAAPLLDGRKRIETRGYALPPALELVRVAVLQSPDDGGLRAHGLDSGVFVGEVVFAPSISYPTAEAFNADEAAHLVPKDHPLFGYGPDTPKHGWEVLHTRRFPAPVPVDPALLVRDFRSIFLMTGAPPGYPSAAHSDSE